jgi:predicted permease
MSDLKYAIRQLTKRPGFTAAAVLTLALGIGAATTIFSVVHGVLLRPLPYPDQDRLVMLWEKNPELSWMHQTASPANMLDWRARSTTFQDITTYMDWESGFTLGAAGANPEFVRGIYVFGNFFEVFGASAHLGRGFTEDESWRGADDVVVLTYDLWRRRFDADSGLVGGTIFLDGEARTVVGVMPPGFTYPRPETDLWVPIGWNPAAREEAWFRRAHMVRPVARLAPGVTLEQARSELETIAAQLEQEYPATNRSMGAGLTPLHEWIVGDTEGYLLLLLGAVGLLLLIGCLNIANLFLARVTERRHELAVRSALGAGRRHLARGLMIETVLIALLGGAAGVLLAGWGTQLFVSLAGSDLPRLTAVTIDVPVMLFALAITMVTALVFGTAPVALSRTVSGQASLAEGGRTGSESRGPVRFQRVLIGVEVALAALLVVGAGLMVRTLQELARVDPGFDAEHVLTATLQLPGASYRSAADRAQFHRELVEELSAAPGVTAAGTVEELPLRGTIWTSDLAIESRPPLERGAMFNRRAATPGYFDAMGVPIIQGRAFDHTDVADAPRVIVINLALAQAYFPSEDPIGRRIAFDREPDADEPWYTIVGVVGTERIDGLRGAEWPEIFVSAYQVTPARLTMVVRSSVPPESQAGVVRSVVDRLDPDLAFVKMQTLQAVVSDALARERFLGVLFGTFAMLALTLAAVGIYGVMAYAVSRRQREMGIRLALGAGPALVVGLVVRQGMTVAVIGVVTGLVTAGFSSRLMRDLLFGITELDPVTYLGVAAFMGAVALTASYIPARRAARVDPMEALRNE